jgi:hypothetical protein
MGLVGVAERQYWQMERTKGAFFASIAIWSAPAKRSGDGALAHPIRQCSSGIPRKLSRLPSHSTRAVWDC